jgi:tetratricopeptide (TPR) repeat protein
MSTLRIRTWTTPLVAAWMLAALCAGAQAATISGVVRDAQGKPLGGAHIKLTNEQASAITAETTSDNNGAYRLQEILPGTYHLAANLSGFILGTPAVVIVPAASSAVSTDFTLKAVSQNEAANAVTSSHPALTFEAAGVRGLIDPGGYSAPANAAAASGLISGMADIKRADNNVESSATKDLPCMLEPELKRAVEANPQDANALLRLGEFYLAHRQPTQAAVPLKEARQLNSTDLRIARDMADALLMNQQFEAAQKLLAALPADQMNADMHQRLARSDEGLGQFTQASSEYQAAAKLEPSEQNLFGVGYELILAGLPPDAEKDFMLGIARYPQSVTLLIGIGTAEFLEGHSIDALKNFLQAAEASPSDPRPYPSLVQAFKVSGAERERVNATLKHYLEIAPHNAEAYYLYAVVLSQQSAKDGNADKIHAKALLKQAIILNPNLVDAHFQLGILYAESNDHEAAAREFEETVRLAPNMKEAHYRLAIAYRSIGRTDKADHEMQLFRKTDEPQKSQNGDAGISIEKFISVVASPESPSSQQAQCSADPH